MLIYIDDSVIEELTSGGPHTDDIVAALEELALARRRGKHLVLASPKTLCSLRNYDQLGATARSVYRRLYNDFPEQSILKRKFVHRLQITGNKTSERCYQDGNCTVLSIPIYRLTSSDLLDRPILLGENLLDCELHSLAGRIHLLQNKLQSLRIEANWQNGGGSTTGKVFAKIVQARRHLCLCILDSDKACPTCPEGTTAQTAARVRDDSASVTAELYILSIREAENLLSSQTMEGVDKVNREAVQALVVLESAEHEALRYLDLKKGLKLYDVVNYPSGSPAREYWSRVITSPPFVDLTRSIVCTDDMRACGQRDKCKCIIVPGHGNEILERAHESVLRCRSLHEIKQMLHSSVKAEWEAVGRLVAAWCCASPPLVT